MDEPDSPDPLPTQPWTGPADPTVRMPQDGTPAPTAPGARPGGWQAPEPEQLQASFPQYEIQSVLGRGGMGAVYKGWQKSLKRFVAIKILPPGLEDDGANFAERFQREAQAMARFSHPGIVAVFDAGETPDGLFYFVMEYIEGTDVQKMVRENGPLPPEHALAITAHVCDALAYAHKRGVIHRDIKPANIMVDAEGQVKVADFGLAKVATDDSAALVTGSHVSMGTMDFMAPEALYGMGHVDHRADLYAVGVMLYQMLTGEVPRGRFELPSIVKPELDPRFDAIIDRAMQKNPEKRYANATDIRSDLDQILTAPVPHRSAVQDAPPPPAPAPAATVNAEPPLPRRHPRRWLSSALAASVLLLGIGAVFVFRSKAPPPESEHAAQASQATGGTRSVVSPTPAGGGAGKVGDDHRSAADASGARKSKMQSGQMIEGKAAPSTATKDAPFVNTLGMKFVPVPGTKALFSIWLTRVQDYAEFAKAQEAAGKKVDGSWKKLNKDGVPVGREADHPVVGVSWDDAQAFCAWLTAKETAEGKLTKGSKYRLPTDAEWSTAVGLPPEQGATPEEKNGKNTVDFPWGREWPSSKTVGNYADAAWHGKFPQAGWMEGYDDGYATTSPVGSFPSNEHGLYDMGGNVWQWCEDWFDVSHQKRVLRGASWGNFDREHLLSSCRLPTASNARPNGFRCVLEPAPSTAAVSPAPNLPVSKSSDPKFPPGQWVKLFTKPEDLPADLRKPDSGVTWEDGWINLGSNSRLLRLPDSLVGNYAIRARFKRGEGESNAIVMRYQGGSGGQYFQFRLATDAIICQRRVNSATYRSVMPPARVSPPAPGQEYVLEVGVVGTRLIGRMDDKKCIIGTDTDHLQGAAHIRCNELLRDIEVINLDGLPEAEALRLLGVDEQGNDLRGKGGAAGPSAAANGPAGTKSSSTANGTPSTPTGDWVSMMDKIHPATDAVSGEWTLTAEGLFSKGGGTNGYNVLQLPGEPPEEYDFRVSFSAPSGRAEIHQVIAAAGREFVWSNAGGASPGARFSRGGEVASELVAVPEPLAGRRHESLIEVRRDRLTGYLDGKRVVEWKPDFARLPQTTQPRLRQLGRIGVACWSNGTTFHDISLRQIGATAKPPAASSSVAAAATKDAPFVNTLGMKFVPVPGTRVLFSIWHTRVQDYAEFAKAQEMTGKKVDAGWKSQQKDSVPVGREADHPVVGVSWDDAQAFCAWLTEKETAEGKLTKGAKYRLPTDAEWSTAVGLPPEPGATPEEKSGKNNTDFPWGKEWPPKGKVGNYADESFHTKFPKPEVSGPMTINNEWIAGYDDDFATTSPVGSFPANAYGLYDMGGNVWQWCEDWWNTERKDRVLRGAMWLDHARVTLRSSNRTHVFPTRRHRGDGFRCVLEPAPSPVAATPGTAPETAK